MSEYIGYLASGLVLISFLMKDIFVLRIVNTIGCLVFIIYGSMIDSLPVIITNAAIVLVNLYYLISPKLKSSKN
jgi:hypothetical protein